MEDFKVCKAKTKRIDDCVGLLVIAKILEIRIFTIAIAYDQLKWLNTAFLSFFKT